MNSTLAVLVAYHPTVETLANVRLLLEQVSQVIIVDNEASPSSRELLAQLKLDRVFIISNPRNEGVAKAINQGIRWGLSQNFDFFLLMDQDSQPQPNMVTILHSALKQCSSQNQLSLVGPRHEDFSRAGSISTSSAINEIPLLITSGSLVSKAVIEKIGLYDEKLFIDHVDHDYCLRLKRNGGASYQINEALLLHRFGQGEIKSILGKQFFLQSYSPFRRYYMMRNRILLYRRYGIFAEKWFWMDLRSATKDIVKLIFFESNKKAKLIALARGPQRRHH